VPEIERLGIKTPLFEMSLPFSNDFIVFKEKYLRNLSFYNLHIIQMHAKECFENNFTIF